MGVEIPIAGFPEQFSTLEDGNVVLIVGGDDSLGRFFAHRIAYSHTRDGGGVTIISSRPVRDVNRDLRHLDCTGKNFVISEDVKPDKFRDFLTSRSLVIIDRFDYLIKKYGMDNPYHFLEEMRNSSRKTSSILVLITSKDWMEGTICNIMKHNVDAVIRIESSDKPEGTSRFFRIEKWTDGKPFDNNIFFKYENNRFNIDLRSKVI